MFPHPQTVYQLREMDRRFLLVSVARERAARVARGESTRRSDRGHRQWALPLPRLGPRRWERLPLAWFA